MEALILVAVVVLGRLPKWISEAIQAYEDVRSLKRRLRRRREEK